MSLDNHPNFHAVQFVSDVMHSYYKSIRGRASCLPAVDVREIVLKLSADIEKKLDDFVEYHEKGKL